MKYHPESRTLEFASDDEVALFHAEMTEMLREAVTSQSAHGDAEAGRAAAQGVFKRFACVLRGLNALRRHLAPRSDR